MNSPYVYWIVIGGFILLSLFLLGLYIHVRRQKKCLEKALASKDLFFDAIINDTVDSIYLKDPQHRILAGNNHYFESIDRPIDKIIGFTDSDFFGEEFGKQTAEEEDKLLRTGQPLQSIVEERALSEELIDYVLTTKVPVIRNGQITGILGITRGINSLAKEHVELSHYVTHDPLTGLYNRPAIRQALNDVIAQRKSVAILFIDIDNFKQCNDQYGHEFGDEVLKLTAKRMEETFRKDDLVGRLSGDEFIIILQRITTQNEAEAATKKLLSNFESPLQISDISVHLSLSVGIVCTAAHYFPTDITPTDLLRFADQAMYRVKHHEKGKYEFYRGDQEN